MVEAAELFFRLGAGTADSRLVAIRPGAPVRSR
jgi:hypothetical protein